MLKVPGDCPPKMQRVRMILIITLKYHPNS